MYINQPDHYFFQGGSKAGTSMLLGLKHEGLSINVKVLLSYLVITAYSTCFFKRMKYHFEYFNLEYYESLQNIIWIV